MIFWAGVRCREEISCGLAPALFCYVQIKPHRTYPNVLYLRWGKDSTVGESGAKPSLRPGSKGHRYLKVCGYGTFRDADGDEVIKPQINLNAKWLAEAGFSVGDQIEVAVAENALVIRKMIVESEKRT